MRAGLAVSAAGAALAAGGAASAHAAVAGTSSDLALSTPIGDLDTGGPAGAGHAVTEALRQSAAGTVNPAKNLRLDPLAGTGVDPLSNSVGTQIADFKPLSSATATGPLSRGDSLGELPVTGPALSLLPD